MTTATGDAPDESERFWEDLYRGRQGLGAVRPNAVLVDLVSPLAPGTALDLGCAEGGDALWLARRGWRVTAVDVSATVLARAAERAAEAGVADRIDWQRHDLARTLPTGTYDLVSASYLQSPVQGFDRDHILRTAARAVAPEGRLLVVDHGSVAPWSWAHPDSRPSTADQLLARLDLPGDWRPELIGSPQRQVTGPDGQTALVVLTGDVVDSSGVAG